MNKLLTMALVCAWAIRSWACLPPVNIEGVAFTADEVLDIQILIESGTEGINCYIDSDGDAVGIRYMSHYNSHAMVFIGNYGMSYQKDLSLNCMGIVLPLPDDADIYEPIPREEFDFALAVTTELAWLVENNVIALTDEKLADINEALSGAANGGNQYWTHADNVLGYNSWFNYDTTLNQWVGADGVNGVYGVKGISETDGVHGCSAINPAVEVPPEGFVTTGVLHKAPARFNSSVQQLRISHLHNGNLTVTMPQKTAAGQNLTVFDCRGVSVYRKPVPAGIKSLIINGLPRGMYFGQLR